MRVIVLAAVWVVGALMLASCTTPTMTTNTASTGQQASNTATEQREAPIPPALRTPRQQSGVGWPDIGYRPHGY
jgi:hypothetical protein